MTLNDAKKINRKAMIFAAGLGTRLAPLTNDCPKALVKLRGKPLLQHVIERLAAEGFTRLTVNVHHFSRQIIDYLNNQLPKLDLDLDSGIMPLNVQCSDETAQLLDTGGGLKKAAALLFAADDSPVLVHNVDILSNAHLAELYAAAGDVDALLLVSDRSTTRYLLFDADMCLVGWQNIQTGEVRTPYADLRPEECHRLAFSGIHVVNKSLTNAMSDWPDKFGIIDFYIRKCAELNIRGYVQPGLQLIDIGKIEVLRKMEEQ
ncbi:MAG: NTP transferase domain-containing protein [Bacteroidaceae bacterium]|nr:NTP transferase domain-containing protein [Bacteroidaceae bacterium]